MKNLFRREFLHDSSFKKDSAARRVLFLAFTNVRVQLAKELLNISEVDSLKIHVMDGSVEILLVEDYEPDARLTALALKRNGVVNKLHIVHDAHDAIDLLAGRSKSKNTSHPGSSLGLVLVDIHLPRMDGWEVLRHIKQNDASRHLGVVMLSGHLFPDDLVKARELGALGCLTKPLVFEKLLTLLVNSGFAWSITGPAAPTKR